MIDYIVQLLIDNPLLLLFVVAAIGFPLGNVRIAGTSIGVVAVLFVGLGVGALHPDLQLPEIVYLLGLVLFVYTIGLSSGPVFFASFRRKGVRDNLFVVGMIVAGALLTVGGGLLAGLSPGHIAGLFTGSLTNTPALAAALDYIQNYVPEPFRQAVLDDPIVAYSISYPMGSIGMLLAMFLMQRYWKVNYAEEAAQLRDLGATSVQLKNATIRITNPDIDGRTIAEINGNEELKVVFGRVKRDGQTRLATGDFVLRLGDLITAVGEPEDVDVMVERLGAATGEQLQLERSDLDYRRVFVSNPKVAGSRLRDLNLPQQFGAIVTRVRRGDLELMPHGNLVLELGDRVRVTTTREQMPAVSRFFGDSYRALSEVDVLTFSLGLAAGLVLGIIQIPLPGGTTLQLGLAGGPLVMALFLGYVGRTGPFTWVLSYSANLTLRQIGLVLFLAGIGTRAGYTFYATVAEGGAAPIFLLGTLVTCSVAFATLWVGYRLIKIPMSLLTGMLAGLQTAPALLAYATQQSKNDIPSIGYATVYPLAIVVKIVLAQLILALLL